MFFHYNARPSRLLHLFRAFHLRALRLRRHRSAYGGLTLLALPLYLVALIVYGQHTALPAFTELFFLFAAAGSGFLLIGWGYATVFRCYPYFQSSGGGRFGLAVVLLFPTLFLLSMLSELWDGLEASPLRLALDPERQPEVWMPWLWACGWLWLLCRTMVWLRMGAVQVQEFELDYLYRVLKPLLRDLPADTRCWLRCNPFAPFWTAPPTEQDGRGGRSYIVFDDVLLDFRAELPDGTEFALSTLHRRSDKHKRGRKKVKYKGTKHRLAQIYRFRHPALRALADAQAASCQQLPQRWQAKAGSFASELRSNRPQGKLTVVQKSKQTGQRKELQGSDLPSAELTLETVRQISGWISAAAAGRGHT